MVLLGGAFGIFFGIYYKAELPEGTFLSDDKIEVMRENDYIAFQTKDGYRDGIIFYQGAKVDEKAYAPLLREIAKKRSALRSGQNALEFCVVRHSCGDGYRGRF